MNCEKRCNVCGSKFIATNGNQCYCSEYCREIGYSASRRAWQRQRYQKRPVIKEKICAVCGKPYRGHYNSKYCDNCMKSGNYKMRSYYDCRAFTEENSKEG